MKSAFKKLFHGKSKDGRDGKDPLETVLTDSSPHAAVKDSIPAANAQRPAHEPPAHAPASLAPAPLALRAEPPALGKLSLSEPAAALSPFTQLNSKIVSSLLHNLHPKMSAAQSEGIATKPPKPWQSDAACRRARSARPSTNLCRRV